MSSLQEDLKRLISGSNVLGKYIIFMVLLFFVLRIVSLFNLPLSDWLSLPQQPGSLAFRPWSVITYMFSHEDFRHILWNLILLWVSGRILIEMLGEKRFVKAFWIGGLTGGLLFFLVYNLHPALNTGDRLLLGASAAVLSVLLTATLYRPHHVVHLMLIGPVKLMYITIVFLLLTIPQELRDNLGGNIAHLGGVAWGTFYGWRLREGQEPAIWFERISDWLLNTFTEPKVKRAKMKTYRNDSPPPRDDKEYNARKKAEQDRIDHILDKISNSGYESLSKSEKAILFKASNKE